MKYRLLIPLALMTMVAASHAQNRVIFRCANNNYTDNAAEAKAKGCKAMEGGNITVIEGTRVNGASGTVKLASTGPAPSAAPQRVDVEGQRARDSDSRLILDAELKKAETRQAELVREYNNGEPEMLGPEHRNHQKYLERTAELKAGISRNENDIAGIKRELGRVPSASR